MLFAPTPLVSRLTELSTETLREWTSRRALIPADIRPQKKGSPAQFSWQTVLILRLAVALRNHFHVELQVHKALFDELRVALRQLSFIGLWGRTLSVTVTGGWSFIDGSIAELPVEDAILIRLDPHLDVISAGFALPHPNSMPGQLDLFPVQIAAERETSTHPEKAALQSVAGSKRAG